MQKYCGCVFSEEDRYQKQIEKDKITVEAVSKNDNDSYVKQGLDK